MMKALKISDRLGRMRVKLEIEDSGSIEKL